MNPMTCKNRLRDVFLLKRSSLNAKRREQAQLRSIERLSNITECRGFVFSYASFRDEFDTRAINALLLQKGKLALPKMEDGNIKLFHVTDSNTQLKENAMGIYEPLPNLCKQISLKDVSMAFVPGIAFDHYYHRIGYGGGYYDRLLWQKPHTLLTYGLGFQEQLHLEPLPIDAHDVKLNGLFLF